MVRVLVGNGPLVTQTVRGLRLICDVINGHSMLFIGLYNGAYDVMLGLRALNADRGGEAPESTLRKSPILFCNVNHSCLPGSNLVPYPRGRSFICHYRKNRAQKGLIRGIRTILAPQTA